jgi:hypothetical protein
VFTFSTNTIKGKDDYKLGVVSRGNATLLDQEKGLLGIRTVSRDSEDGEDCLVLPSAYGQTTDLDKNFPADSVSKASF